MARTGRPATPSVRYYLPNERADKDGQTKLRGVATYAKKRLTFTLSLESWELFQVFSAIKSDGTLRDDLRFPPTSEDFSNPESPYYTVNELSAYLVYVRKVVLEIMQKVIAKGAWERMTSADLKMFLGFFGYMHGNDKANEAETRELFKRGGLIDTWLKKTR